MNEAKKKARELVERFKGYHVILKRNTKGRPVNPYVSLEMQEAVIDMQSKEFALICVDEIMNSFGEDLFEPHRITFWQQVKQELNSF